MTPLLQEAANEKTLKRAFRRLCLRYHPDIIREDDEESPGEKFQAIQEAYRILSTHDGAHLELPNDLEWSNHDWRWKHRYEGAGGGDASAIPHKMAEEERKAKVEDQLKNMAGAPTRRKRRVIKPLSKVPTPQPAGLAYQMDDPNCPSDGCPSEWAAADATEDAGEDVHVEAGVELQVETPRRRRIIKPLSKAPAAQPEAVEFTNAPVATATLEEEEEEEEEEVEIPSPMWRKRRVIKPLSKGPSTQPAAVEFTHSDKDEARAAAGAKVEAAAEPKPKSGSAEEYFSNPRHVRGYQSARHSTESAHERINAQLAGLHRKRIIRARARGEEINSRHQGKAGAGTEEAGTTDKHQAARFYGGVGLQLEESTPERFVRLAKLAKNWREERAGSWQSEIFPGSSTKEKLSPKELLMAAVEGVSLGACT